MNNLIEVFWIFLKLGITSFGGPIAHLGFFHDEFVVRRKWVNEHAYADLVALCQFLPGPASSQVGMALGFSRAGYLGALAAWIGFTIPSAVLLVLFAFGVSSLTDSIHLSYLHGLKIVAVAIVGQAIWGMITKLCPDKVRASIAVFAAILASLMTSAVSQIGIIAMGAALGIMLLKSRDSLPHSPFMTKSSRRVGTFLLALFVAILIGLPFVATFYNNASLKQFDSFYRAGSLVFGGGHVVLPLLKNEVVNSNMVSNESFMAGYGAAQAIPGPLFSFSAYLGAVSNALPSGIWGALICLVAVFLPSFLLILGVLPFWESLRKFDQMKFAMKGINATVVGLLLAAFYNPVWTSAILTTKDFAIAIGAFLLLALWKTPPWLVVILTSLTAGLLT